MGATQKNYATELIKSKFTKLCKSLEPPHQFFYILLGK